MFAAPLPEQERVMSWRGEPLIVSDCPFGELSSRLPLVVRRPFRLEPANVDEMSDEQFAAEVLAIAQAEHLGLRGDDRGSAGRAENPHRSCIVRLPGCGIEEEVPLAAVSPRYRIVQHFEVIDSVDAGLSRAGIKAGPLRTTLRRTRLGGRVHFTVHLPEQYRTFVGETALDLTIECLNSVDGSWALRIGMGWMVEVCSNGLFSGRLTAALRRTHVVGTDVQDVPDILGAGFVEANAEAAVWTARAEKRVTDEQLRDWVDGDINRAWGAWTATRVLHIARTGCDAIEDGRVRGPKPSERPVRSGASIPGSSPPNNNVFRIAQVLAWIANRPGDWGTAIRRRREIPRLIAPLLN
jgi:hypothetical protein